MSKIYDVVIVGGGPAGLSAAIYLARAKYSVLVIEQDHIGGQITITSEVVNYPGVFDASGKTLTQTMRQQAQRFGAEFQIAEVQKLVLDKPVKEIITDQGQLQAVGLVLATGANPRQLGFTGEKEFQGRGIAYCATCDGEFFQDCPLFVIGGGFAACEEAIFLTQYASEVTMIVREEDFTCAKSIADEVRAHPQIKVVFETEIIEVGGDELLEYAVFRDNKQQKTWRYDAQQRFGIFVFAGYIPNHHLFKKTLVLDEYGYLIVDKHQQTSQEGVYGAGDICEKDLRQVVTAVSDGAIAATSLEKYVSLTKGKDNIETITIQKPQNIQPVESHDDQFIDQDIRQQLQPVFDKLTQDVYLVAKGSDDAFSQELKHFINEFSQLHDLIHSEWQDEITEDPSIVLMNSQKQPLGVTYSTVPGGHEFNSFVLAVYNAGSEGQPMADDVRQRIERLDKHQLQVFISLSCTMCPEVVQAAQRIALLNPKVDVIIYDIAHHQSKKDHYKIMSVPCLVIDNQDVNFGKKGIEDILDKIEKSH